MLDLLRRFRDGLLDRIGEARLIRKHQKYFRQRAKGLNASFFPGGEKSPDGIESACNGAYVSFGREVTHYGRPAFIYAADQAYEKPWYFLYFWRGSAMIQFLRREGPPLLAERARIQRNVRLNLTSGFIRLGKRCGEQLWGLPDWKYRSFESDRPELSSLRIVAPGLRGRALITRILELADQPLTRAELAAVIEGSRMHPELTLCSDLDGRREPGHDDSPPPLEEREIEARVVAFMHTLKSEHVEVLVARGYGEDGRGRVSWTKVAEAMGKKKTPEAYRRMEMACAARFREAFSKEERQIAARQIANYLSLHEAVTC